MENPVFEEVKGGSFLNKAQVKIEPWHCCLFEYEQKLYMLFCSRDHKQKSFRSPMETYLAVSEDYHNFRYMKNRLFPTSKRTGHLLIFVAIHYICIFLLLGISIISWRIEGSDILV